jgi:hypothetical protein
MHQNHRTEIVMDVVTTISAVAILLYVLSGAPA